jgi:hypothetical protein
VNFSAWAACRKNATLPALPLQKAAGLVGVGEAVGVGAGVGVTGAGVGSGVGDSLGQGVNVARGVSVRTGVGAGVEASSVGTGVGGGVMKIGVGVLLEQAAMAIVSMAAPASDTARRLRKLTAKLLLVIHR